MQQKVDLRIINSREAAEADIEGDKEAETESKKESQLTASELISWCVKTVCECVTNWDFTCTDIRYITQL